MKPQNTDCPNCRKPDSGVYSLGCPGCRARLVRSARPSSARQKAMLEFIGRVWGAEAKAETVDTLTTERDARDA